jgi:hypothetical protein
LIDGTGSGFTSSGSTEIVGGAGVSFFLAVDQFGWSSAGFDNAVGKSGSRIGSADAPPYQPSSPAPTPTAPIPSAGHRRRREFVPDMAISGEVSEFQVSEFQDRILQA